MAFAALPSAPGPVTARRRALGAFAALAALAAPLILGAPARAQEVPKPGPDAPDTIYVPYKDLEKIFRCFEQSALGSKTSHGTGLGLTLSRAMVELQGGRIWAESWKGLGASFFFTVPILRNDMARPVEAYPKPVEYHGLLVSVFRRMNSFVLALFA